MPDNKKQERVRVYIAINNLNFYIINFIIILWIFFQVNSTEIYDA